ncbi:MAG: Flp pilus assembly protein CpaB [Hyphomicrobiaceae bacterium]
MKRARMVVLGIAVLAAGAAAFLANGMTGKPRTKVVKTQVDTVQVLVAKGEIRLGDSVKATDFAWMDWPSAAATTGYITKAGKPNAMSDLTGAIARAPFLPGEPIKEQKLIKANEGGVLAAILPAGMRAISTKIAEDTAAGGFILPNDRVDVIVTRKVRGKDNRADQHISDTLFRNVRVLAIGQDIEVKDGKKTASAKTATLELSPSQAETLALAQEMGDIRLTLRSLEETRGLATQGPEGGEGAFRAEQSTSVKMLKYGAWSRAYGVK